MTAVEWLIHQYIKDGLLNKVVYEQALEMEKQQIIDAYLLDEPSSAKKYAEQYYNETYNK